MAHPDIPREQAYLDHAYECLREMRQALLRTVDAAAMGSDGASVAIDQAYAWVNRRLAAYDAAEQILCFGRIDVESIEKPLYVGRRWVQDDDGVLVVNWQAPAARPFYATPAEPHRGHAAPPPGCAAARSPASATRRSTGRSRTLQRRSATSCWRARPRSRLAHARHRGDDPG